ncbi:MAG TPA: VOC family protein [Phytomonospora sp.]
MTTQLLALTFDANDPQGLARFWAGVLGREVAADGVTLPPRTETGFPVRFLPTETVKAELNQMHFDLTSDIPERQAETVERALALGGSHLDVGQLPEEGHTVLADPEGNEFCVIPAGNNFLADTDFIGALSSDGSQAVGYFWSEALGWPLVWDENEETAIQSPDGGTKIAWGGPPVAEKPAKNRLHWDLITSPGGDLAAEVARLSALGAARIDIGQGDVPWAVMADPDGNEFCVYPPA